MDIQVVEGREYQTIVDNQTIKVRTFYDWADEIYCTVKRADGTVDFALYNYRQFCEVVVNETVYI